MAKWVSVAPLRGIQGKAAGFHCQFGNLLLHLLGVNAPETWEKQVDDQTWSLTMKAKHCKIEQLLFRTIRAEKKAKWVRAGKSLACQQMYIKEPE